MRVVVRKREAEHEGIRFQIFLERRDDRNASAATCEEAFLAEPELRRAHAGLRERSGGIHHVGSAALTLSDGELDRRRANRLQMLPHERNDFFRVLIRNEAHRDLRARPGGDDRFSALALVAAGEAVDFKRGPRGALFIRGVSGLAEERRHPNGFAEFRLVERHFRHLLPLVGRELHHVIVEARDRDRSALVAHRTEHLTEDHRRVVHRPAEEAGVQVAVRAVEPDFNRSHAPERVAERGMLHARDLGVRNHQGFTREFLGMLRQKSVERLRADFLFALDQEIHVARQFATGLQPGFDRVDMGKVLPLVVADAAGIDIASDPARLEGRRGPELERIRRLNVVVAIHQKGRLFRIRFRRPRDHHRVAGGLADFGFQAGFGAPVDEPFRAEPHIARMVRLGADARDASVGEELFDESVFIAGEVFQNGFRGHGENYMKPGPDSGNPI